MSIWRYFNIVSITTALWLRTIESHRQELLNTIPQAEVLLNAYRADIDSQFDENQAVWTPLKKFTVDKKKNLHADPRILHETLEGHGLRLRDAYKQAGSVSADGVISYTYPVEKPYAKEHQEGGSVGQPSSGRGSGKRKKMDRHLARHMARLDKEYEDLFNRSK